MPKEPRERLIALLDYVEQVVRLDERVAFRLSEYRLPDGTAFAIGEPDTRNLPGIAGPWSAWATEELPKRRTIALYQQLYKVFQMGENSIFGWVLSLCLVVK